MASVTPASAHDEFRFVGSLTAANVAKNVVTMKFKDEGKDVAVNLKVTTRTLITRDRQRVAKTELKAGLSVVVDALGDDYSDLEALEDRSAARQVGKSAFFTARWWRFLSGGIRGARNVFLGLPNYLL